MSWHARNQPHWARPARAATPHRCAALKSAGCTHRPAEELLLQRDCCLPPTDDDEQRSAIVVVASPHVRSLALEPSWLCPLTMLGLSEQHAASSTPRRPAAAYPPHACTFLKERASWC